MLYTISFMDDDGVGIICCRQENIEGNKSALALADYEVIRVAPLDEEARILLARGEPEGAGA